MSDLGKNPISCDERNARIFDSERCQALFENSWLEYFLSYVPGNGHILDLGCGAGQPIAAHLIKSGYRVTGVDSSPVMIKIAKDRFPNEEWIVEDICKIKLEKIYDGVLAWDSFFDLTHEDQREIFRLFGGFLKRGAPLIFTAGPEREDGVDQLYDAPVSHASFSKDEYFELLHENGFENILHRFNEPDCGNHSIYCALKG